MAGKGEALAALAEMRDERERMLRGRGHALDVVISELPAPLEGDGWELPAGETCVDVISGRFYDVMHMPNGADMFVLPDMARRALTIDMVLEELGWGGGLAETPQVRKTAIPASKPFQVLGTPKVVPGQKLKLMTGRDGKGKYHTLMTVEDPPEGLRAAIDEYDKSVLVAVCTLVEARGGHDANGTFETPLVIPVASIFRAMCGTDKPKPNQRAQVIESLAKMKFTPVLIDASRERGGGWAGTGGLEGIIEGNITWDYAESGTTAECLTLYKVPAFLMHAKRLGQVIGVRPELLAGDGSTSNTRKSIPLHRLLLERVDMFKEKGEEYSVIRITRSPTHPDGETVFERAGYDMSKPRQRTAAIEEAERYLEFLRGKGELGGIEILNESGETPAARGRGAARAYIKLHGNGCSGPRFLGY